MPEYNFMPYMQQMMPMQTQSMMQMPQEELEAMYPRSYHLIYPLIRHHCDMHAGQFGPMHTPTRRQLDDMIDNIYNQVSPSMEENEDMENSLPPNANDHSMDNKGRQIGGFGFGRRRPFLRDLISVLLLRDLIGRRRRPYYGGYPGYYGGYGWY